MTDEARAEMHNVFTLAIETYRDSGDLDQAAKMELVREYFINPDFRKALENLVWSENNV
jgi:hypothetical protein